MSDRDEEPGRARGPEPDAAADVRADGGSNGLSKRAARRRRRRRGSGAGEVSDKGNRGEARRSDERQGGEDRPAHRGPQGRRPEVRASAPARDPAAAPKSSGKRRRKGHGKPEAQQGEAGLRGVRSTQHGQQRRRPPAIDRAPAPAGSAEERRKPQPDSRSGRRSGSGAPLYAALDLGTNNCRLLVAEPQERGFRVVDAFSRIVRLGEGIGRSGRLSEAAMDRAVEALAVCRAKMTDLDVRRMRLIATEACRAAENGPVFLERVRAETGLSLEIVNRETEARLAVAGCATLVDPLAEGVILFDIGGGSSELVWLDLRNRGNARGFGLTRFIKAWTSLQVGVVTLSERHGGVAVTPPIFAAMVEEVSAMLDDFTGIEELSGLLAGGRVHMLGTSGTVTTLAGIHLGLKRYDRRRVDGLWMAAGDVDRMVSELVAMDYEDRVAHPCIGGDRADLVLAGCAILEAIRRRWPVERLRVADRGLREGILVELMARDGVWRRRPGAAGRPPAARDETRGRG